MLRIALFLLTNMAILIVASTVLNLLGFSGYLQANGVDLNLTALLIFCGIFGMSGSLISLFISKWMAKRSTGTQIITNPRTREEQWLMQTVKELSDKAGIKMPEVGIFPSHSSNAFATGWNRNDALVAVSQGLLQRFRPEEVRAVLAHEIGHVANGDMVTLTLIQGVVNTFVMFFARVIGHTIDRVVFKTERGYSFGYYIVVMITEMLLAILASAIVMWFSRWREFRADHAGATLADRQSMIAALQRLQAEQGVDPGDMPGELTAFGIRKAKGQSLAELFSSHPPLEKRIEALRQGPR
ncbi:heat shock protein HtpX [Litorivivens lipolytica]|uniref:Protease HtpX n=1 Tax=Litorivivens lipolytica TaxID=1524264 RepID=A0A7W4W3Y3_9GAMM|nr:protease HtpX [Litorivivens lipolytica]MBB3046959.1 heat shock protein HtpX [Litorivivens lipolytica]